MTTVATRHAGSFCSWCRGSGRAIDLPCPCTLGSESGAHDCPHCSGSGRPNVLCVYCTGAFAR